MGLVSEGDLAPDVELVGVDGSRVRLSQFRGRIVVLYFYPKAFTPGCTREAVKFNELYEEFRRYGAEVIGVSIDPLEVNARFAKKHGLRFKVASDPGGKACRTYGVLRGLGPFKFADRVTLVIDREGRVVRVIKGLFNAEEHALKALEEVKRLAGEA